MDEPRGQENTRTNRHHGNAPHPVKRTVPLYGAEVGSFALYFSTSGKLKLKHFDRYKDDFMKLLAERAPSFGVKNLKIISFAAQRGYSAKYTALDVCVAVNALLELSGKKEPEQNFHTGKFDFFRFYYFGSFSGSSLFECIGEKITQMIAHYFLK